MTSSQNVGVKDLKDRVDSIGVLASTQDKTRQDETRRDETRRDETRRDKTRQDKTRQDGY